MYRRTWLRRLTCGVSAAVVLLALASGAQAYRRPGKTERISLAWDGSAADQHSNMGDPGSAVSRSGRYVVFNFEAPNMVRFDTNLAPDTFLRDRRTRKNTLVSVASSGVQAISPPLEGSAGDLAITPNGRFVVFQNSAVNLVDGDTNLAYDVFVRDLRAKTTERVSVSSSGKEQKYEDFGGRGSSSVGISANGRWVVFDSFAPNLVPNDTNEASDIFLRDRRRMTTVMISRPRNGEQQQGRYSNTPSISANGRYIQFDSYANLVQGVPDDRLFTYVYDRKTRRFEIVSVDSHGTPVEGGSERISGNGRYSYIYSPRAGFVPNDTNGCETCPDIFVHDRKTGRTERVSVTATGAENTPASPRGNPGFGPSSSSAAITFDGRYAAFPSSAALEEDDTGELDILIEVPVASDLDVYVHDLITGATFMATRDSNGNEAGPCEFAQDYFKAGEVSIADRGRFVTFATCAGNLVPGDENLATDIFLRDISGSLSSNLSTVRGTGDRDAPLCVGPDCIPRGGALSISDPKADAAASFGTGDLIGLRAAYRPQYGDLYLRLDADRVALSRDGRIIPPAPVYGVRIETGGSIFEARSTSLPQPTGYGTTFSLYDCTREPCHHLRDIEGSLGTVGEVVTMSIPLDALALGPKERIDALTGFSGLLAEVGPLVPIDSVGTRRQ